MYRQLSTLAAAAAQPEATPMSTPTSTPTWCQFFVNSEAAEFVATETNIKTPSVVFFRAGPKTGAFVVQTSELRRKMRAMWSLWKDSITSISLHFAGIAVEDICEADVVAFAMSQVLPNSIDGQPEGTIFSSSVKVFSSSFSEMERVRAVQRACVSWLQDPKPDRLANVRHFGIDPSAGGPLRGHVMARMCILAYILQKPEMFPDSFGETAMVRIMKKTPSTDWLSLLHHALRRSTLPLESVRALVSECLIPNVGLDAVVEAVYTMVLGTSRYFDTTPLKGYFHRILLVLNHLLLVVDPLQQIHIEQPLWLHLPLADDEQEEEEEEEEEDEAEAEEGKEAEEFNEMEDQQGDEFDPEALGFEGDNSYWSPDNEAEIEWEGEEDESSNTGRESLRKRRKH